jgi:hypothetical protein
VLYMFTSRMLVRCYEDNVNYDVPICRSKTRLDGVVDANLAYRATVCQLNMIFMPPLSKLFNVWWMALSGTSPLTLDLVDRLASLLPVSLTDTPLKLGSRLV